MWFWTHVKRYNCVTATGRGGDRAGKERSFSVSLQLSLRKFKLECYSSGMLKVIPMGTTNKRVIKHTQKEMKKNFSISLQNINYTQNKKCRKWGTKIYKACREQVAKWQKSLLASDYFKCKWIKLSNQKTEIDIMEKEHMTQL